MRLIDVRHLGRERVIGCWQVGEVLVDPGPSSCLPTLLDALGDTPPRALLLTHIHLDHAGASGSLVQLWPELEVYVHERGAPHLVDPSRLLESARRLYGEDMDRLWGDVVPVPESQLRVLHGGETLFGGSFEVAYTPGHASHHVSYLHDGTAFVGDVGGVRIPPAGLTIPPTPPPDIDVEAWHQSIELIAAWRPQRLAITHFGETADVSGQLAAVGSRLDGWAELVRRADRTTFLQQIHAEIEGNADAATAIAYTQAAPPEQLYAGLERYWRKRAERGDGDNRAVARLSQDSGDAHPNRDSAAPHPAADRASLS
jgi:glyoxylase-like metal-dependent hydrolase (beta-lactamase superfamily II)